MGVREVEDCTQKTLAPKVKEIPRSRRSGGWEPGSLVLQESGFPLLQGFHSMMFLKQLSSSELPYPLARSSSTLTHACQLFEGRAWRSHYLVSNAPSLVHPLAPGPSFLSSRTRPGTAKTLESQAEAPVPCPRVQRAGEASGGGR